MGALLLIRSWQVAMAFTRIESCVSTVQPAVDAAFYGSKKSVLVGSFHFEVKEGRQKKAIQKHKEIQASEEIFQ